MNGGGPGPRKGFDGPDGPDGSGVSHDTAPDFAPSNPHPITEGDAILAAIQAIEAADLIIHNICHVGDHWRANIRDDCRWEYYDAGTLLGALQGVLARWRAGDGVAKPLYRPQVVSSEVGADDLGL